MSNTKQNDLMLFGADWCMPCKALKRSLEEIGMRNYLFIDVDNGYLHGQQFGIKTVPTMVIVNDKGEEVDRKTGALTSAKLTEWLLQHNVEIK